VKIFLYCLLVAVLMVGAGFGGWFFCQQQETEPSDDTLFVVDQSYDKGYEDGYDKGWNAGYLAAPEEQTGEAAELSLLEKIQASKLLHSIEVFGVYPKNSDIPNYTIYHADLRGEFLEIDLDTRLLTFGEGEEILAVYVDETASILIPSLDSAEKITLQELKKGDKLQVLVSFREYLVSPLEAKLIGVMHRPD